MLCLLKADENLRNGTYVDVQGTRIFGVPAVIISARPPGKSGEGERALREVLTCLSEMRPRRIVYGKGFPYARRCVAEGCAPAGADFHAALAPKAAAALRERGDTVYIRAARADRVVLRHLEALRHSFRHILADIGGGEGLLDSFVRQYGVSIVTRPSPERVQTAHVAVFYDEQGEEVLLSKDCAVIVPKRAWLSKIQCGFVVTELTVQIDRRKWPPLPDGFPPEPLFSAALEAGTLTSGDLVISGVTLTERENFMGLDAVLTNAGSNSII